MPTATESKSFSNISATTAAFRLGGGRYGMSAVASGYGTALQLQTLSADGTTFILAGSNFSAAGYQSLDLPPGSYRIFINGASGAYVELARIPS